MTYEDLESETELSQFSPYKSNVLRMIEHIGYDLTSGLGLNFGKGRRILLLSFIPKGKAPDYYHQTRGGWAMCQLQSRQSLSLKSHYTIITCQARHHGSQMSVSAASSKNYSKHGFNKPLGRWR